MSKLIVGNWKMNGNGVLAAAMATAVSVLPPPVRLVICPPALWLTDCAKALGGSAISLGAQDCHPQTHGAYTGDLSAQMLKESGCSYVIVGHSERRQAYGESNMLVVQKAQAALSAGLIPIVCVGETLAERQAGGAEERVVAQARQSMPLDGNVIIAYEPIWAIGTGLTPTIEQIQAMHVALQGEFGENTAVLYGGSVKSDNAGEILAIPEVGGALVGGASLKVEEMVAILAAVG